jgi:hypothetical protein
VAARYDIVVPTERWVGREPSPDCRRAVQEHVRRVVHEGRPGSWAGACRADRPWTSGEYRAAMVRAGEVLGGLRLVVGSSFGAARVDAALASPGPAVRGVPDAMEGQLAVLFAAGDLSARGDLAWFAAISLPELLRRAAALARRATFWTRRASRPSRPGSSSWTPRLERRP